MSNGFHLLHNGRVFLTRFPTPRSVAAPYLVFQHRARFIWLNSVELEEEEPKEVNELWLACPSFVSFVVAAQPFAKQTAATQFVEK